MLSPNIWQIDLKNRYNLDLNFSKAWMKQETKSKQSTVNGMFFQSKYVQSLLNDLKKISCDFSFITQHQSPNGGSHQNCSHLVFKVVVFEQKRRNLLRSFYGLTVCITLKLLKVKLPALLWNYDRTDRLSYREVTLPIDKYRRHDDQGPWWP